MIRSGVVPSSVLLLLLLATGCPAYLYDYYRINASKICPGEGWPRLIWEVPMTKHALVVEDAGAFRHPGANGAINCHWATVNSIKDHGIVAVVQNLQLNEEPGHLCQDNLEFDYESWGQSEKSTKADKIDFLMKGLKICQSSQSWYVHVNPDDPVLDPLREPRPESRVRELISFTISEEEMKRKMGHPWSTLTRDGAFIYPWEKITTNLHIRSAAGEYKKPVKVYIAYTLYSECDGDQVSEDPFSDLFHCGHGLCILKRYVDDGVVNCPFKDCADENSCVAKPIAKLLAGGIEYPMTNFQIASIAIVFGTAVAFVLLLGYRTCRRERLRRRLLDQQRLIGSSPDPPMSSPPVVPNSAFLPPVPPTTKDWISLPYGHRLG